MQPSPSKLDKFLPEERTARPYRNIMIPADVADKLDDLCREHRVKGRATLVQAFIKQYHEEVFNPA